VVSADIDAIRAYWIERCLRLEHRILVLEGKPVAPLLPQIERRAIPAADPLPSRALKRPVRRIYNHATPDEIALKWLAALIVGA
jgi:hypothetical protein